jgi:hypothetical protein
MGKIMEHDEMMRFIESVGRAELFDELKELKSSTGYPRYLKGVRAALTSLGYDSSWVNGEFRTALEAYYMET